MKLSKTLIKAMLIAVTAGTISSCEKPSPDEMNKNSKETSTQNAPNNCPGCGMG